MRFFYHYNKPLSKARGKPQISVHWKGACHFVDNVVINVPTWGRINKRQPYFVIVGDATNFDIEKGIGFLYDKP